MVGDQGGGRDEIYWTAATNATGGSGRRFESGTHGAVERGDNRNFYSGNRVFHDGATTGFVGTSIQVWEADQSNDRWWAELRRALNDALASLETLMLIDSFIGIIPGWVGAAFEISKIFVFLMDAFRNYDGLSCQRTIGIDRTDLAVLAARGEAYWQFDGDGHHQLTGKYTGEPVPFPVGTLEYLVRTADSWGTPVALPWQSMTAPALASYNNKPYALFVRPSDKAVMWSRLEGTAWLAPARVGGDGSHFAPAVASYKNRLYYSVTGGDNKLWWRTYTEAGGWSAVAVFNGYRSYMAPSLAAHSDGNLYQSHVGPDGDIWTNSTDGSTWGSTYRNPVNWSVTEPAPLGSAHGNLWRIIRGGNNKMYTSTMARHPAFWQERSPMPSAWETSHGLALAPHGGSL